MMEIAAYFFWGIVIYLLMGLILFLVIRGLVWLTGGGSPGEHMTWRAELDFAGRIILCWPLPALGLLLSAFIILGFIGTLRKMEPALRESLQMDSRETHE